MNCERCGKQLFLKEEDAKEYGFIVCVCGHGNVLSETGKEVKIKNTTSKVEALTVDIKLGNTPLEFAEKLIELLCKSGVSREIVEDVEHLIGKSLVSEIRREIK